MIQTTEKHGRAIPTRSDAALRGGTLRSPESTCVASRSPARASSRSAPAWPTRSEHAFRILALIACALAVAHLLTTVVRRTRELVPEALRPIFDMSAETSLNTWFTVIANLALGLLVCALARLHREKSLYAIGGFFVFLSMDDQVMLHERLGRLAWNALGGSGTYPWLLAVAPIFAAIGLLAFVRLWRLCGASRALRVRLALGFACLALALGVEWIESRIAAQGLRWRGHGLESYTIPIEEGLELLGPALLIACVGTIYERARRSG